MCASAGSMPAPAAMPMPQNIAAMPAPPSVAATPASSTAVACASSSSTAYGVALPRRVSQAGRASSECLALVLDGVLSAAECASLVAVHGDATKLQRRARRRAGGLRGLARRAAAGARLGVLRYAPGERFEPHYDLVVDYPPDRRSLVTVLVYLTDGFEGGDTAFLDAAAPSSSPAAVAPRVGRVVLFEHGLFHSGQEVVAGFEAEELDIKCCEFLDDDDIKELIPPLGPRKRFKEAIKKRQTSSSPVTSRAAAVVTPTVDDGARADDDDERSCAICFDELANPVRVDCAGGHEFCRRCWLGWCKQLILKSSTSTTCPSCRADVKLVLDTATMKPFEADRPRVGRRGRRGSAARGVGAAARTGFGHRTRRAAPLAAAARIAPRGRSRNRCAAEAEAEAQRRAAVQARRAAAKAAKKERQRERKRTQVAPAEAPRRAVSRPAARPPRPRRRGSTGAAGRCGSPATRRGGRSTRRPRARGSSRACGSRPPPAVAVESFESMLRPLAAGAPQAPIPPSPLDWPGL
ncbi:hypothetical protein JL721_4581 [Aureococcus anophagefferens]|nr:hypothetical protein JL721_4581 [Aureococcus anophagefferens]